MSNLDYTIWTDGGCAKNPNGKGGYGVVIQNNNTLTVTTHYEGFISSTNNRMEVRAIIRALSEIPDGCSALIYSDSKYAVCTFNGEFRKKKNIDLWEKADELIARKGNIVFQWVKGHADNDNNNLCDELATQAMQQDESKLINDDGFIPIPEKSDNANIISAMDVTIIPIIPNAQINPDCAKLIADMNNNLKPTFSDFLNLKTFGRDFWSQQKLYELAYYAGQCAVDYVKGYFNDEAQILSTLRWYCRGLNIEKAVRKTLVDAEILQNRQH